MNSTNVLMHLKVVWAYQWNILKVQWSHCHWLFELTPTFFNLAFLILHALAKCLKMQGEKRQDCCVLDPTFFSNKGVSCQNTCKVRCASGIDRLTALMSKWSGVTGPGTVYIYIFMYIYARRPPPKDSCFDIPVRETNTTETCACNFKCRKRSSDGSSYICQRTVDRKYKVDMTINTFFGNIIWSC